MDERRSEPRTRSVLGGKIAINPNRAMECMVKNVSPHGAYVVLPYAATMPDNFRFAIPHRDATFEARLVWRRGEGAGLALVPQSAEAAARRKVHLTPRMIDQARRKQLARSLY
jgi:hypothetical protein